MITSHSKIPRVLIISLLAWLPVQPATAFELLGARWPNAEATQLVNINGTSPSGTSYNDAFEQATQRWRDVLDTFTFKTVAQVSHPCAGYVDGIPENGFSNGVGFYQNACGESFGKDVLAVTLTIQSEDQELKEADIVFNQGVDWNVYAGEAQFESTDFRRVAVHELGHFLGLDHEPDAIAIMNPFVSDLESPVNDDIAGAYALYPDPSSPQLPIIVILEEPGSDLTVSGVSNIRGWAVASAEIEHVEIWLDGVFFVNIPYGGSRADVGAQFPGYPNADESGFSMALAWGLLSPGQHTIAALAYDKLGRVRVTEQAFYSTSFDNPFISDPGNLSITGDASVVDSNSVRLSRVNADGRNYSVLLRWNTASQKFEMVEIKPTP